MTHIYREREEGDDQHILNPNNISIDRIDSKKGYTLDNIRLICASINKMRLDIPDDMFRKICAQIMLNGGSSRRYLVTTDLKCTELIEAFQDNITSIDLSIHIDRIFTHAKDNATKRNMVFELVHSDVIDHYCIQKGKCMMTGNYLTFLNVKADEKIARVHNLWNISIDRIDSEKGYTKDNIQLVGSVINRMKNDLTDDIFYKLCYKVSMYDPTVVIWSKTTSAKIKSKTYTADSDEISNDDQNIEPIKKVKAKTNVDDSDEISDNDEQNIIEELVLVDEIKKPVVKNDNVVDDFINEFIDKKPKKPVQIKKPIASFSFD
jgi:hypothetical protein